MPAIKHEKLAGWGNVPTAEVISYRPEKYRALPGLVGSHEGPLLARGLGRSYGDASLQPKGVVRMERFDHVISFDAQQGILRAQAGVTLDDVMKLSIPRGWFPPVIPGTRQVTLGGAFACNVHGKNHYREGDFAEHVLNVRITLGDGSSFECSKDHNSELFWATAGGMGMTGIIEELTLQLKPIASASLRSASRKVKNIEDMVEAFVQHRGSADYMIGWIDHTAKGPALGRGVFSAANHILPADGGVKLSDFKPAKRKLSVPVFAPAMLLNRYLMALYNALRFRKFSDSMRTETVGFDGFFHPLDSIGGWNKLYGKRGFYQYQCMIPDGADVTEKLRTVLSYIQEKNQLSYLGVIKYHREGLGLLTFPITGYSLALDFPNTASVRELLPQLDALVAAQGGRVYLAKDAQLSPEQFAIMYPNAPEWLKLVRAFDPQGKFSSLMSQRLQWKPYS